MSTRFIRWLPATIVLAGLALLGSTPAEAGFLLSFSGNTRPFAGSTVPPIANKGVDGSISFAVLNHTGGVAGDTFGTGLAGFDARFLPGTGVGPGVAPVSPAFDITATFLYLFQVVNDGPRTVSITQGTTDIPDVTVITSWGRFTATDFHDASGNVVAGNPLGHNGPFVATTAPPDTAGGSTPYSVVNNVTGKTQTLVQLNGFSMSFVRRWDPTGLLNNQFGILTGFTSNRPPIFVDGSIIDHGSSAIGTVVAPLAVPEPSGLALVLMGGLTMLAPVLRRRKVVVA